MFHHSRSRKFLSFRPVLFLQFTVLQFFSGFTIVIVESNVFKGESVTRGVFMFVRRGVSLVALRRKLFVNTNIINKYFIIY